MKTSLLRLGRAGFTLIEILVTLILLSVLAAAVFPVVTQQIGAADAPTLANDLSAMKTALQTYNANVGTYPGDVEDLVHQPVGTEHSIQATTYTGKELRGWNGPYLEMFVADGAATLNTTTIPNGYGDTQGQFVCVDGDVTSSDPAEVTCAKHSGHYVAVELTGMTVEEFLTVNDVVDLSEDGSSVTDDQRRQQGKLRCDVDGTVTTECASVYFLATPYAKR